MFQLAASFFTSGVYVRVLLRLLCLRIVLLLDNVQYTAQLLYTTSIPIFGQLYEMEALISEFEVSPAVWNVLTPKYRDRVKKHNKTPLRAKTCKYGIVLHCLYVIFEY